MRGSPRLTTLTWYKSHRLDAMKTFLKKLGGFSLGPLLSALLGLILVPVITRFISPEEYGKAGMFTLAQGLCAMILYLGLDQAYAREFMKKDVSGNQLLSNVMLLPLLLSAVLAAGLVVFRRQVSLLLFSTADEGVAICLMALMFPFMVIQHFGLMKVRLEEKGLQYSLFSVMLKVWNLLLAVSLLVIFEKSFRSVVYAAAFAEIINGVLLYLVAFRGVAFSPKMVCRAQLSSLLRYALPLVPATLLSWMLTSMDKVMLRTLCSYTDLGLYTAAFKIVSVLGIVQTCFTTMWVPIAFRWYEEKKADGYFVAVMKGIAGLMSLMCFGVLLFKDVLVLILGSEFGEAVQIFPFLMLYPILYTMSETTAMGIAFTRRTEFNIVVSLLSGGANLLLNLLLIPRWGGVGAAVATGVSYIVFFCARTVISRRLWIRFPVGQFAVYLVLILVNCVAHTWLTGFLPYTISAASIAVTMLGNIPFVKSTLHLLRGDGML